MPATPVKQNKKRGIIPVLNGLKKAVRLYGPMRPSSSPSDYQGFGTTGNRRFLIFIIGCFNNLVKYISAM